MNLSNALREYLPFGVCLAFCAGVWGLFRLLERDKSLAKQSLIKQINDLIQDPGSIFSLVRFLPDIVLSTFDTIFTNNLLSRRAFVRSCIISAVTVSLLLILWYSTKPANVELEIGIPRARVGPPWRLPFQEGSFANYAVISRIYFHNGLRTSVNFIIPVIIAPLIYNFLADYLAIIATKYILLSIKTHGKHSLRIIVLFVMSIPLLMIISDIMFTVYIMFIGFIMGFPAEFPGFFPQANSRGELRSHYIINIPKFLVSGQYIRSLESFFVLH
jgi:hypothetical protein